MTTPEFSVILSTYNQPEWLAKVLWGYAAQVCRDFEVVIADDGSRPDTRAMLEALQAELPFAVQHVWHEDRGFRKCTILNRAILAARADYLLFSDGDCVPRNDFVAVHRAERAPGRFLSGGYFKLPRDISVALTREDIASGNFAQARWLRDHGLPRSHKLLKLSAGGAASLLNLFTPTRASWNGHNASGWKADLLRANGFDERMEYGGEDRELGERLTHAGIRGKQIRYSAICLHLDHDRGYVKPEMLVNNRRIRDATRRARATYTEYGIEKRAAP